MAFSEKARTYAFEELERRRASADDRAADYRDALYLRFPALLEFDRRIASLGVSLAKSSLKEDFEYDSVMVQMREIQGQRARFLAENKVAQDAGFYFCERCSDTGYREGKLCVCAINLMREYSLSEINRVSPLELSGFGSFSLDYYSTDPKDGYDGLSPRKNMANVLARCVDFARRFDADENLLMMGDAGLGKTHLALAIAGEVLNRGFEVIYCSAANIFKKIETEYYEESRSTQTIDSLKRCDLLVLDDLGAEYVNAFTASVIYDIVNTRAVARRSCIYTTNITRLDTLETRYGEKVSSRLTGCCRLLSFFGADIRLMMK
ncbi:MAG: ATP-binding protein [Oscillospiraceae bacterium]|nr:ATP-binding protein [Oscillospiraceae bacterium]